MEWVSEQTFFLMGITLIVLFLAAELIRPRILTEGFESAIGVLDKNYFTSFAPKRGDIGIYQEEGGYIRDSRYFQGYVDIQRLGVKNDFCRMVQSKSIPDVLFFSCALAGTENISSVEFASPTTASGFKVSRDDYMRDVNSDGRDDYCRILKSADGSYQPLCSRSTDSGFDDRLVVDSSPPSDIATLLTFYDGCVFWLRLRDDMLDYVSNIKVSTVGGIKIDETPRPSVTKGIRFNGMDQYLRIGDSPDLDLGTIVPLRSLRAISFWVFFEEFTNNAHIIDFGNGAGVDNVFVGIVGKGDEEVSNTVNDSTVPSIASGAQPVDEVSPQKLMLSTSANVNEYTCTGFEMQPRKLPPSRIEDIKTSGPKTMASLLYEVWDKSQRKMRVVVPGVIPVARWTHVVITAKDTRSFRPDIDFYINGTVVYSKKGGHLPQASTTTNNYIGKSNWTNVTSQYANKDELFKGLLFDLRGYKTPMDEGKVTATYEYGQEMLGIESPGVQAGVKTFSAIYNAKTAKYGTVQDTTKVVSPAETNRIKESTAQKILQGVYDTIYTSTPGTSAQKTEAALKARNSAEKQIEPK